jgi:hypothetical protein
MNQLFLHNYIYIYIYKYENNKFPNNYIKIYNKKLRKDIVYSNLILMRK